MTIRIGYPQIQKEAQIKYFSAADTATSRLLDLTNGSRASGCKHVDIGATFTATFGNDASTTEIGYLAIINVNRIYSLTELRAYSHNTYPLISPPEISGCLAWYDPDDSSSVTLSGSNITQINDKSGNSNHATQGTVANQPLIVARSASTNYRRTMSFVSNDWLSCNGWSSHFSGSFKPFTMSVVARQTSTLGNKTMLNVSSSSNNRPYYTFYRRMISVSPNTSFAESNDSGSTSTADFAEGSPSYEVLSVRSDGGTTVNLYRNTTLNATLGTGLSDPQTVNQATIGCTRLGTAVTGSNGWSGELGEIVVYNTALSDANMTKLLDYMVAKARNTFIYESAVSNISKIGKYQTDALYTFTAKYTNFYTLELNDSTLATTRRAPSKLYLGSWLSLGSAPEIQIEILRQSGTTEAQNSGATISPGGLERVKATLTYYGLTSTEAALLHDKVINQPTGSGFILYEDDGVKLLDGRRMIFCGLTSARVDPVYLNHINVTLEFMEFPPW